MTFLTPDDAADAIQCYGGPRDGERFNASYINKISPGPCFIAPDRRSWYQYHPASNMLVWRTSKTPILGGILMPSSPTLQDRLEYASYALARHLRAWGTILRTTARRLFAHRRTPPPVASVKDILEIITLWQSWLDVTADFPTSSTDSLHIERFRALALALRDLSSTLSIARAAPESTEAILLEHIANQWPDLARALDGLSACAVKTDN